MQHADPVSQRSAASRPPGGARASDPFPAGCGNLSGSADVLVMRSGDVFGATLAAAGRAAPNRFPCTGEHPTGRKSTAAMRIGSKRAGVVARTKCSLYAGNSAISDFQPGHSIGRMRSVRVRARPERPLSAQLSATEDQREGAMRTAFGGRISEIRRGFYAQAGRRTWADGF